MQWTDYLVGAASGFAAAFFTLFLGEVWRRRTERSTAVIALATELARNLRTAGNVLAGNARHMLKGDNGNVWWTILSFSDASWRTVVNSGLLSRMDPALNSPLAEAYTFLSWADDAAQKLQTGKVWPRKAKDYTARAFDAAEKVEMALSDLESRRTYRQLLKKAHHLREARSAWSAGKQEWRSAVDRFRERQQ